jgi:hypothetical protein
MDLHATEAHFLDADGTYTAIELVELTGLHEDELHALVDSGALETLAAPSGTGTWTFAAWSISVARNARSLRDAYALADPHSVAVVTRYALRVAALQRELDSLRSRTGQA